MARAQVEDELLRSFMMKRPQKLGFLVSTAWKRRWFILNRRNLIYYSGDLVSGPKKERRRLELYQVVWVEVVDTTEFGRKCVFQVCHQVSPYERCVLYIAAGTERERSQWLQKIRSLVAGNQVLSQTFHPQTFDRRRWRCCSAGKTVTPCSDITWTPESQRLLIGSPTLSSSSPTPQVDEAPVEDAESTDGAAQPDNKEAPLIVEALYHYEANRPGDLTLNKHDELLVLDKTLDENWWHFKNINTGAHGVAPSNFVKVRDHSFLKEYEWYLGPVGREEVEQLLTKAACEGGFVVRDSATRPGFYTLSVFTTTVDPPVRHYHIRRDEDGFYYVSQSVRGRSVPEMVDQHRHNPGGLSTRLKPITRDLEPKTTVIEHLKIDPNELRLLDFLSSGESRVVRRGRLRDIEVVVKVMKPDVTLESFMEEAQIMAELQHPNLVQLLGVCCQDNSSYIVTEHLPMGSLLFFLRNNESVFLNKTSVLLSMSEQVCSALAYMNSRHLIHRNVSARNCFVGPDYLVKLGNFRLCRQVESDLYVGFGGSCFAIKWTAPEVLWFSKFSSKSDVWAFGVLLWEVFSCGKIPYGRRNNQQIVDYVSQGNRLDQPRFCPDAVYQIMIKCWEGEAEQRPSCGQVLDCLHTLQDQDTSLN
ncbi:tyrosine-protein kinase Btk [Procambarus clarkii]|uniref:tyrosine-protein kinase Btk n=1 Tax=Procambarus clarkii TaxID=6728 RepID=UPI003742ED11